MRYLAQLMVTLCVLTGVPPAFAGDLIYAPGTRIGLVPLIGLSPSKTFPGFETDDHGVKVVVAELPAAAFKDVEAVAKSDPSSSIQGPKPQGLETASGQGYFIVETAKNGNDTVRRYSMVVAGDTFSGYVAAQVPENVEKIYSDEAVRKMFATVALRKEVPVEEQLGLLPFKLTELSSFKTVRTLGPGAILLSDAETDHDINSKAFLIINPIGSVPERPEDRGRFARDVATTIPNLREAHITMSEPIRINGSPGFETRIDATNSQTKTPVTVVQWLVFGSGNTAMRLIGSTPRDEWATVFPRFRAVRDGIRPR